MLTMITGLPGAGKSLYALALVQQRAQKEGRAVYYEGIENLTLPWLPLDGKPWFEAPQGSIVVIDECQRRYRPRGLGQAVPEEVQRFETHRHGGFDIYLITQHPMLVDSNVRRLVNQHFHVMRKFGAKRATVHEFPAVRDTPDKNRKDSIRHEWVYPKKLFSVYKSAELHTHKLRIPMRVWLMLLIPLILLPVGYKASKWFYDTATGEKNALYSGNQTAAGSIMQAHPPIASSGAKADNGEYSGVDEYVKAHRPVVEGLPQTAPIYQAMSKPQFVPVISACIASADRCQCYSQQGTKISMPLDMCRNYSENRYFQDFPVTGQNPSAVVQGQDGGFESRGKAAGGA